MPIRPDELVRPQPPSTIAEDRKCRSCGYNLRGLSDTGKCPECGKPVRKPKDPARWSDQMSSAPLAWLKGYQLGTLLLCLGAWFMIPSVLGWIIFGDVWFGAGALAASAIWAAGTMIATRPRPRTPAMGIDPKKEWTTLRALARWSQWVWALAMGLGVLMQAAGWANPIMGLVVVLFGVAGILGWWPLLVLQSHLAYWAADTDLSDRLRNVAWGVAPALGVATGMIWLTGSGWGGFAIGKVMVYFFWVGLIVAALGYLMVAMTQLWRMAHWALVNHITAQIKNDRLREQVRKAERSMERAR